MLGHSKRYLIRSYYYGYTRSCHSSESLNDFAIGVGADVSSPFSDMFSVFFYDFYLIMLAKAFTSKLVVCVFICFLHSFRRYA